MNYTIYVGCEPEIMTRHLGTAEAIAETWDPRHDVRVVDNSTGEVVLEYPGDRG